MAVNCRYLHRHNWIKVAESGLVSVVSAVAGFLLMFGVRECTTATPNDSHAITTSVRLWNVWFVFGGCVRVCRRC